MRFRGHKYIWTHPYMSTRHHWEVLGPIGGVHFSASIMDNEAKYPDPSCGLEFHHAFDPTRGQEAPAHLDCPITGGRCWHDGTSLYAVENLWPIIHPCLKSGDHSTIFRLLEGEYDRHFADYERPGCGPVDSDQSLQTATGQPEMTDPPTLRQSVRRLMRASVRKANKEDDMTRGEPLER